MYGCILTVVSLCVFLFSQYTYFTHTHSFDHMVAFIGHQHVRKFEHDYKNVRADLWAFGHRKRKSMRLHFGLDAFETFRDYDYTHMLLLHELHEVPLVSSDDVIEYKLFNKTVASLWPYLSEWPGTEDDPIKWYRRKGGFVSTVHL